MSLMLGPIHSWLFRKILLVEERTMAIADRLAAEGVAVDDLRGRYGEPLAGKELATLVGYSPIHGFLQGLITRLQVFEASLVERAGAERKELVLAVAEAEGKRLGERLVAEGAPHATVEQIAQILNDTALEGMPCDPGATFTPASSGDHLDYTHSTCNHLGNWEYTGADHATMCQLVNRWVAGLVGALGGSYEVNGTLADGKEGCRAAVRMTP